MRNSRIALILTGLAFAVWEAISTFQVNFPAIAATFAVLFLACTVWFWRRDSIPAALAFVPLFAVEVGSAPTWQHVQTQTKVLGFTLGVAGIASVIAAVATRRRSRASATADQPVSGVRRTGRDLSSAPPT
jgi:uncharacterized membrane protein